jgi:exopolyphosphatase/guanosine-5'-triphosphate,3'-diphosphate pyrophosphatase
MIFSVAQTKISLSVFKQRRNAITPGRHAQRARTDGENMKKYPNMAAVINIGASELSLHVAQLNKGLPKEIDRLSFKLPLGHEVFAEKKISFKSLREMSGVLSGFSERMKEYGVPKCRAVATTVLREAENRAFVLDQLKVLNHLEVEVLEPNQEKTMIYSEILATLSSAGALEEGCSLFAYIGSGTAGIAVYDGKAMILSRNIPIGALKLHDMLGTIQEQTDDFSTVVEEYLAATLDSTDLSKLDIRNVILTGSDIQLIAKLSVPGNAAGEYAIPVEKIENLYRSVRPLRPDKIAKRYGISEGAAETMYCALAIFMQTVGQTKVTRVLAPQVNLWDALLSQMLLPKRKSAYEKERRVNALSCARNLAKRYGCSPEHSKNVGEIACAIFDRMKPLHGMGPDRRLILELAAALHDCGRYVTMSDHHRAAFDVIRNTDLYGMTDREVLLTAYVARYNEYAVPNLHGEEYASVPEKDRTVIAKLVAIFRLANALDKSRLQKVKNVKVKVTQDTLQVSVQSNENLFLEKWAFEQCTSFFKEVFGLSPVLKIKQTLV